MSGILVLNAGSSSIKLALFDEDLEERLTAAASEIGGAGARLMVGGRGRDTPLADHEAALRALLAALAADGIDVADLTAAAHRVVHGGRGLTEPARLTEPVLAEIEACIPLAPLHNPHNLAAIRALSALAPDLPQYASFDTAFHATNPEVALRYAVPDSLDAMGIRRYGFHGTSYKAMVARFGDRLPRRLIAYHLGNGASVCAIRDGHSVATSMGYSPLDGLTMGTRTGAVDGMAVLRLAREFGIDGTERLLNRESGLTGLAGTHDMAALLARDDAAARFAVEHFCYWAARHGGSMAAAMGGADAIAFTGGIGENAGDVRDRIAGQLGFLGALPVHIVPAEEERQIARDALSAMRAFHQSC